MTNKELIELLEGDETRVVIAQMVKTGGCTIFPLIKEVVSIELPFIGESKVIVFES